MSDTAVILCVPTQRMTAFMAFCTPIVRAKIQNRCYTNAVLVLLGIA